MARYGPADATVTYNGTLAPGVTVIGALSPEANLEEITPLGVAWESSAPVGVSKMAPIVLEEPYDSAASPTLRALVEAVGLGGTATLLVKYGGTKTTSVSTLVQKIERPIARGALSKFRATLQPTGTVTEV